jgi:tyrosine-protein phosphatase SIW14
MAKNGISFFHIGFCGNVEPFQSIPVERFAQALNIVLDPANHPILVHCNRGKHRTGCLMGVLRRMCGWSISAIMDEYARFAGSRRRYLDAQFIELFDISPFMENV